MSSRATALFRRGFGALALASTLAACGGGGSAPPAASSVRVLNAAASSFSSAEVYDSTGQLVAAGGFACATSQSCVYPLPVSPAGRPLGFRFRDAQGRLVGASPVTDLGRTGYSITADNAGLGLDLFAQLESSSRYSATTLSYLLDAHVYQESGAGAAPSIFEDLAAHYQRAAAQTGISESQYISMVLATIKAQVGSGVSAPAEGASRLFPKPLLAAASGSSGSSDGSSATDSSACPDSASALINIGATGVGASMASANPIAGALVIVLGSIVAGACDSASTSAQLSSIVSKLDAIQAKLDSIDTKLSTVGIKVDALAAQSAFTSIQQTYAQFNAQLADVNTIVGTYQGLLRPESSSYSLPSYPNLSAYMKAQSGGFNQASYDRNAALKRLLGDLSGTVSSYNKLVSEPNARLMASGLQGLCQNPEVIYGDIVARRNQCNILALKLLSSAAAATNQLSIILYDAITAIDTEFTTAIAKNDQAQIDWLRATFVANLIPGQSSWQATRTQLLAQMITSLNQMSQPLVDALIAPTNGLPSTLLANLIAVGCDKSVGGLPQAAVEGWVINEASPAAPASPSRYIVPQCKGRQDELVYSRLFYTTDLGPGDTFVNVLGTLVKPGLTTPNEGDPGIFKWLQGDGELCSNPWNIQCDWYMNTPGLVRIQDATGKVQATPLRQVRTHTAPLPSGGLARAQAVDDYEYDHSVHLLQPITDGCCATGYTEQPVQQFWSAVDTADERVYPAYMTYTWVSDVAGWMSKPDPRYTRTVVFRIGQKQKQANKYFTYFMAWCAGSSDCKLDDKLGVVTFSSLTFSGGPKLQWGRFGSEADFQMFVDGRAGDGRSSTSAQTGVATTQ